MNAWIVVWLVIWLPPLIATLALDPFAYVVPGGHTLSSYVKRFLHARRPVTRALIVIAWITAFTMVTLHFMDWLW